MLLNSNRGGCALGTPTPGFFAWNRTVRADHPPRSPSPSGSSGSSGSSGPYVPQRRFIARRVDDADRTVLLSAPLPGADPERFMVEAEASRRLVGPWVSPRGQLAPPGGPRWYASPYLPALPLPVALAVNGGPLPERSVRAIGAAVAETLATAHAQGITHAGVSPAAVLLAADGPRLTCFGAVRAAAPDGERRSGLPGLEPGSLAPEQAAGGRPRPPGDIYALGSVLAYAATGHTVPEASELPPTLRLLVSACLTRDPANRPTAAAVLTALAPPTPHATVLTSAGPAPHSRLASRPRRGRPRPPVRRNPLRRNPLRRNPPRGNAHCRGELRRDVPRRGVLSGAVQRRNQDLLTMLSPLTHDDPRNLSRYLLLARLGSGGMGTVYLARNPGGRTVALKTMHAAIATDLAARTRFRLETDAARIIGSQHGAAVVDADPLAETPWLATEYVLGPPLDDAVTLCGPLLEPSVRALGAALAGALGQLHSSDVVHRDLKPSNVMVTADGPKVIDFGIARAAGDDRLTRMGVAAGTPAFMSPEQATGQEHTSAGDAFALAGVLVYAAAGHGPFGTGQAADLLYRVRYAEPDLTGAPEALAPILARCLAKDPAERPGTARLAAELPDGRGDFADHLPDDLLAEIARRATEVWQYAPYRLPAPNRAPLPETVPDHGPRPG